MELTLLGTASAEGLPGLFCQCATCGEARKRGGKDIRTRSSALIDGTLKIDFPPDILSQVVHSGVDLSAVTTVLFTHGHADHFSPAELQYRGQYFVTPPPIEPLALYGPHDVVDQLKCLLNPQLMDFTLHLVEPERPIRVAGYETFPFLANHDESLTCLNYVLTSPDGTCLLYASDTGWYDAETWRLLEHFRLDGVVVECTKREDVGYSGHLSIPEVFRMRRRLLDSGILRPNGPVIATHFSHQMGLKHDELEAILAAEGILAAYDGITLEILAGS